MDFAKEEINYLIDLAEQLKYDKGEGTEWQRLAGKI